MGKSLVKNIFYSFIDHGFEERRNILKGKQREGGIISVHPLIRTSKRPDILLELGYIRKN